MSNIFHGSLKESIKFLRKNFAVLGRIINNRCTVFFQRLQTRISLLTKVFLVVLLLLLATFAVVSNTYYQVIKDQVLTQHKKDTHLSITQINNIMDLKLQKIADSSETIMQDRDILRILQNINPNNSYELLVANREINRILVKYFGSSEWIYAYNFITDYFRFGDGFVPFKGFFSSDLGQQIMEANGRLVWYPTYDFAELFEQDYLSNQNFDFRYLFSAGRVYHGMDTTSNEWVQKLSSKDTFILLLCFREEFFKAAYSNLIHENGSVFIVTHDEQIVSSSGGEMQGKFLETKWISQMLHEGSGVRQDYIDGDLAVICYDTSKVTGWTLFSMVKVKELLSSASSHLVSSVIFFILPFALVSLALAIIVSLYIAKPFRKLLSAMNRTGRGDFSGKISVRGYGEFNRLITQYNEMNDRIARLIDENYKMKIHEKEAQLKALNAQINPHFLYNTLNLINCMAIEKNAREIAEIVRAISKMLRYTVNITQSKGLLSEEMMWLKNYIFIMSCRYDGQIEYICDVDQSLLTEQMPRLFLQPFVENAFTHGFINTEKNRRIIVHGTREKSYYCFSVIDNGCGISADRIENLLSEKGKSVGIANTYQRLQLMYDGKCIISFISSEGKGTTVTIKLPVS